MDPLNAATEAARDSLDGAGVELTRDIIGRSVEAAVVAYLDAVIDNDERRVREGGVVRALSPRQLRADITF
jgi:5-methylthioribose kinase